jgi:hypothetical protein
MKKYVAMILVTAFFTQASWGQKTDTLIKKLDSLRQTHKESASGKKINVNSIAYNEHTKMTVKTYFVLLGTDFTQEVTRPFHSTTRTWIKVGAFAVLEGGLMLVDQPIQQFATDLMSRNQRR